MKRLVKLKIAITDLTQSEADILVLKYAQKNYGSDKLIMTLLKEQNMSYRHLHPAEREYSLVPGIPQLGYKEILILGTNPLHQFNYNEVEDFGFRALSTLKFRPEVKQIALTIHGIGIGLNVQSCVSAQIAGFLRALKTNNVPPNLEKIILIERKESRANEFISVLKEAYNALDKCTFALYNYNVCIVHARKYATDISLVAELLSNNKYNPLLVNETNLSFDTIKKIQQCDQLIVWYTEPRFIQKIEKSLAATNKLPPIGGTETINFWSLFTKRIGEEKNRNIILLHPSYSQADFIQISSHFKYVPLYLEWEEVNRQPALLLNYLPKSENEDTGKRSKKNKVHISYSLKDATIVKQLKPYLEEEGISYSNSESIINYQAGQPKQGGNIFFTYTNIENLRNCDVVLYVVSKNSVKSSRIKEEISRARQLKKGIISLVLTDENETDSATVEQNFPIASFPTYTVVSSFPLSEDSMQNLISLVKKMLELPPELRIQDKKTIDENIISLETDRVSEKYTCTHEAKMLVIGEGGVGKTSLVKKLKDRNATLPQESDTTKGIAIERVCISRGEEEKMFLNVWDFGGQEIYHATHQFFLSPRSLYVLVDDTRTNGHNLNDESLSYWLQIVELLGGESPMIIIQNEKGDRSKPLEFGQMQARFSFLKDCKQTNLLTGRGLDEVWEAIRYWSRQLPQFQEQMSPKWSAIRQRIERLSLTKDLISWEDFITLCAEEEVKEEEEARRISNYFHDLGILIHFQHDLELKDYLVLNSQWITNAVYKIMEHEELKRSAGRLEEAHLQRIWAADSYKNHHRLLIAFMIRFELCYELPYGFGGPRQWFIPQLASAESPHINWRDTDNLEIKYEYDFMPKGIMARLIIKLSHYIKNGSSAWRKGIFLIRKNSKALIFEAYASRTITIKVAGCRSIDNRELLSYICDCIDDLNSLYSKIKVKKLVKCNCEKCKGGEHPYFFMLDNLIRRLNAKIYTVECEESFYNVVIQELLGETFSHSLRKPIDEMKLVISYAHTDMAIKERLRIHLLSLGIRIWDDKNIQGGEEWKLRIREEIKVADVILLLISPYYLASSYSMQIEVPLAMKQHNERHALVIPVFADYCHTEKMPFMNLQCLPKDNEQRLKPITGWENENEGFAAVAQSIQNALWMER